MNMILNLESAFRYAYLRGYGQQCDIERHVEKLSQVVSESFRCSRFSCVENFYNWPLGYNFSEASRYKVHTHCN